MLEVPPQIVLTETPPGFSIERRGAGPDFRVERRCNADGEEIVVCGRRGESPYRLPALPPSFADPPRDPEMPFGIDLGGGRLGLIVSQVTLPDGSISQRIMPTFRIRF